MDVALLWPARTAKGWTQEQVCARLNAITGGGTSPTLLSAWESGRKRTGLRNRAALSKLFEIPVVQLFAHQDRHEATTALEVAGTGAVTRVLTRCEDLLRVMAEVVVGARQFVASESAAVVPLRSFHGFDGFGCGSCWGRKLPPV
ncbi:helix-turn-helix domain-containing protein [Streptomyces sp. NEAU-H3]|uniref:helix-turn-helix domain-containing protein n=1 Tax=Streptomyces sp. NEAU-H3 TaxID=2720636 RepID=UPI0035B58344